MTPVLAAVGEIVNDTSISSIWRDCELTPVLAAVGETVNDTSLRDCE